MLQFLKREATLQRQRRELRILREELDRLRIQNDRMREAMRRCLSCEYRQESIERANRRAQG